MIQIKSLAQGEGGKILCLLYGANGTGKTSIIRDCHSPGGKSLILATDSNYGPLPGAKDVVDIETWAQFEEAVKTLPLEKYDTVGVDTVTQLVDLAQAHVCAEMNVVHPSDLEYGKAWQQIRIELGKVLVRLEMRAKNLIYAAQEGTVEVASSPSRRIVKACAAMPESSGRRFRGGTSLTGRIEIDEKTGAHFITFKPSPLQEAKDTTNVAKGQRIEATGAALWQLVHGSAPAPAKENV